MDKEQANPAASIICRIFYFKEDIWKNYCK
jgi:hypothetical protein